MLSRIALVNVAAYYQQVINDLTVTLLQLVSGHKSIEEKYFLSLQKVVIKNSIIALTP